MNFAIEKAWNATSILFHEEDDPLAHYNSLDWSSLSWAEKQWANWYIWIGNPVIATGLMSFVMHEVISKFQFASGATYWTDAPRLH